MSSVSSREDSDVGQHIAEDCPGHKTASWRSALAAGLAAGSSALPPAPVMFAVFGCLTCGISSKLVGTNLSVVTRSGAHRR